MPEDYYYRLHHCRPRFKNDIENVLGFVAFGIAEIGIMKTVGFKRKLNDHIKSFGSNALSNEKTINNWRTEISALFGLLYEEEGLTFPTDIALDLANESNLDLFFKRFVATFQYPGGHLKQQEILDVVDSGISFHPGRWLSKYLIYAGKGSHITAPEFCHCALNDLRVTRDDEPVSETHKRIEKNRSTDFEYVTQGDVIRYAMDILDYMVHAHLLQKNLGEYFVRPGAVKFLEKLAESDHLFTDYDNLTELQSIASLRPDWVRYVNKTGIEFTAGYETAIILPEKQMELVVKKGLVPANISTKIIGDTGESMVFVHEKLRISQEGRPDLQHLIKQMPTHLAVGYDIKSIEFDEDSRCIEVKTSFTISPLAFNMIHMTTNEWRVAESLGGKYCIYRLQVTDKDKRLFVLRDPVGQYKNDKLKMIPRDGADIIFSDDCGDLVELLECVN